MFIVGLTGGLATGKSTVLDIFREHGIAVINADDISRKVLEPGTRAWREVKEYFGDDILSHDGKINRIILGNIVFNDRKKRMKLNSITHPRIYNIMMKMIFRYFISGHKFLVLELPLLFETRIMLKFMHKIITVVCKEDLQLERLCIRNGFTVKVARQRIQCQLPLDKKVAESDFVIDNNGGFMSTAEQAENLITILNQSKFTRNFRAAILIVLSMFFGIASIVFNSIQRVLF